MPHEVSRLRAGDAIRIAHISDLHFGLKAGHKEIWDSLKGYFTDSSNRTRPDLLLVTGDIVDSPIRKSYQIAREELDSLNVPNGYFVCPGNHDRHPKGNALALLASHWDRFAGIPRAPAWFDNLFSDRMPGLRHGVSLSLGPRHKNSWKLRLLSMDSSEAARFSAQGFVSLPKLEELAALATVNHDEADLVLLLVHHHLLPIRALERHTQHPEALLNFTTMANAGSFLEALAHAHVDIVLHGHEHQYNWARYGNYHERQVEVNIIGAGSATGVVTGAPCNLSKASFNLLRLYPDRTVDLTVIHHNGLSWIEPEIPDVKLYDRQTVARARFFRKIKDEPLSSTIVKHIEFTRSRDAIIREYRTNWLIKEKKWPILARCSTGVPAHLKVCFEETGQKHWIEKLEFKPVEDEDHTFRSQVDVPEDKRIPRRFDRIYVSYMWRAGALLTEQDMAILSPTRMGPYRGDRYEFAALTASAHLESLTLTIAIPEDVAPKNVHVFVENPSLNYGKPRLDPVLTEHVKSTDHGVFSLTVRYPDKNSRYVVAWKVPGSEGSWFADMEEIWDVARRNGDKLAAAFRQGLKDCVNGDGPTVALYVPQPEHKLNDILTLKREGADPTDCAAPRSMVLNKELSPFMRAWWGDAGSTVAENNGTLTPSEREYGLVDGEQAQFVLPIKDIKGYAASMSTSPPWGLVRVGVASKPANPKELFGKLWEAMVPMLNFFLSLRR